MEIKRLRIDWIDYQGEGSTIDSFISSTQSELLGWKIYFNEPIPEAEAWFVIEGSSLNVQEMSVPEGMLFFGTGDTIWEPEFYNKNKWRLEFLKQFSRIYSCHQINLPNSENEIPFHHWMINSNTGFNSLSNHERNYDFLINLEPPVKSKEISVICSTKSFTPHHARRLEFVEGLKKHFGERLDWFGNGRMPVREKWEALIDYRYTIAIENKVRHNVITEKILDPFLTFTFPIYSGAPNIEDYFNPSSFLSIDIEDLDGSIEKIEKLLKESTKMSSLDLMRTERRKVLNDYNFVQRIVGIAEQQFAGKQSLNYKQTFVIPMSNYQPLKSMIYDRLRSGFSRILKFIR